MQATEAIPTLNRLMTVLCRSLPAYLVDAKPWTRTVAGEPFTAIARLAADQHRYARHLANALSELGKQPSYGRFPAAFAAKNDLALDFLLKDVVACQQEDVKTIEGYAVELEGIPALHALAEEILGNAKGHLDILRGLAKEAGSPKS